MTKSLASGETLYRIKTSEYIREFQRPVVALLLSSTGNLDELFYLSESEFSDLVKMGIIRKIPVLLLFMTAGVIK